MQFSELLRTQRKQRDLTQEQLAELVACSVDLIRKIERGIRRPSAETALRIAQVLQVDDLDGFVTAARAVQPAPAPPVASAASLPVVTTPLLGRTAELAQLQSLLADPSCRLITIAGPGGIGKTHLAIDAARRFGGQAAFVALDAVATADLVPLALAEALGVQLAGARSPLEQIVAALADHSLLLLLDNFEHLADAAELLAQLLGRVANLRLLVTSQERLNLRGEWLLALSGLADQPDGSALELFDLHALRVRGTSLQPAEREAATAICRLLEGNPLALELAAAWLRTLSVGEILAEITRNLDFLSIGRRDLPLRQRGIRAVFDSTWARLDPVVAAALARLSVFAGSFERAAAEAVAGVTIADFAALINHSLLYRRADGRYAMHNLLRQFAAERLDADPAAVVMRRSYAGYFADHLAAALPLLRSPHQERALSDLLIDVENLRLAWRLMVAFRDPAALQRSYKALWYLYEIRGWQREGVALFAAATEVVDPASALGVELFVAQGWLLMRSGQHDQARPILEHALITARSLGVDQTLATALDYLALLDLMQGRYAEATSGLSASLAIHLADANNWGAAFAYGYLGLIRAWLGDVDAALPQLRTAVMMMRAIGDPRGVASCLLLLGGVLAQFADPVEAAALLNECFTLAERAGDRWTAAMARAYLGVAARRSDANSNDADEMIQAGIAALHELGDPWGEQLLMHLQ